jgi:hypothetical protein
MKRWINFFLLLFTTVLLGGCYKVSDTIEPKIAYSVQTSYLKSLQSCFPSLSEEEKNSTWGKEFLIAKHFAKELDFYRAITDFKRSEILLENADLTRKLEIQYNILLCYFLGKKYDEVVQVFEGSDLRSASSSFLAFHDLLIILYESYHQIKEEKKSLDIAHLIEELYPDTKEKLDLSKALSAADFAKTQPLAETEKFSLEKQEISSYINEYQKSKKSVARAQLLNVVLPGAGYLYVGQKSTALTAFLVNGLFIAAAYQFFHHGYNAAGIVTSSFEMGWYFGGIYGAGEAAKFYNEQLYQTKLTPIMNNR